MQKITPFLWFDNNVEEAICFYTSVSKNASVKSISRYGEGGPMPAGTVLVASFIIEGQEFMALNGGPQFKFTEAVSFMVHANTQEEIDYYWEALSEGGEKSVCGWLKDKFGLSWQVAPDLLGEMLKDKDSQKAGRVMQAMMKMTKIEIKPLQDAYDTK